MGIQLGFLKYVKNRGFSYTTRFCYLYHERPTEVRRKLSTWLDIYPGSIISEVSQHDWKQVSKVCWSKHKLIEVWNNLHIWSTNKELMANIFACLIIIQPSVLQNFASETRNYDKSYFFCVTTIILFTNTLYQSLYKHTLSDSWLCSANPLLYSTFRNLRPAKPCREWLIQWSSGPTWQAI